MEFLSLIAYLTYDGSESPILRNSTLFHAILISFHATRNSFHTIPNLFHATRNLFRATPNMFPLILHLVCNICKNNFHHPIWSGPLHCNSCFFLQQQNNKSCTALFYRIISCSKNHKLPSF